MATDEKAVGFSARPPGRAERVGVAVLVLFLLVFPKGGIKLAGVPITWGYLAMGCAVVPFVIQLLYGARLRLVESRFLVAGALVPFQLVIWYTLLAWGTTDTGFAVSLVTTFFVVPLIFLFVLGVHLEAMDLRPLFRLVRLGMLFVAAYGIFLFVYRLGTGEFLEIPYLTVNADDTGTLEDKFIDRGGIFKLISTYNNGNIYGVSILILLPFYAWLERRAVPQAIVKLSLLLTLSRTVWIGLILYEVLQRTYIHRASARALATLGVALAALGVGIVYAVTEIMHFDLRFLSDPNLGGRAGQLTALDAAPLFPINPFSAIYEMVYLSVLNDFGVVGLGALVLALYTPVFLQAVGAVPYGASRYKRALASGLAIYLVVAMSDGAMLFIPVMAFYWFVVSLLLSDNPSFLRWGAAEEEGGPRTVRLAGGA